MTICDGITSHISSSSDLAKKTKNDNNATVPVRTWGAMRGSPAPAFHVGRYARTDRARANAWALLQARAAAHKSYAAAWKLAHWRKVDCSPPRVVLCFLSKVQPLPDHKPCCQFLGNVGTAPRQTSAQAAAQSPHYVKLRVRQARAVFPIWHGQARAKSENPPPPQAAQGA